MNSLRIFELRESSHRIHNPFTEQKLVTLGQAIGLKAGMSILDLGSGSGELLCTWACDHHITGTGVDLSYDFTAGARARAVELGVASLVTFVHGDAAGYTAAAPVDIAACVGATWIGGGVAGTIELLDRSLRPGGLTLIGEPYWRQLPPDAATAEACGAALAELTTLPGLIERFSAVGYDLVEMVLADQDSWDRYMAPQWLNLRRWLDANPGDDMAGQVRQILNLEPATYVRFTREYLGWGVFVLLRR